MKVLTGEQLEAIISYFPYDIQVEKFNKHLKKKGLIKEVFEVGSYYTCGGHVVEYIGDSKGLRINGRGFCDMTILSYWSKLNTKEVECVLIQEAKKRGFKEGVRIAWGGEILGALESSDFVWENLCTVGMCLGTEKYFIFNDGIWATIIEDSKEMTIDQIQKELGYNIKVVK